MLLLGLGMSRIALAESPAVAVIYPDIREPYRSVFLNIVRGIEDGVKQPVKQYEVTRNENPSTLLKWLEREQVEVVIALGKRGLTTARKLLPTLRIIAGAVLITPSPDNTGVRGITLAPDPKILFERLKTLAPRVNRITVVYNPAHNGWLIERAETAAKLHGLMLQALPAKDLREAATLYRDVVKDQGGTSDAIWLLQDPSTVDDRSVLPKLLEEAWNRNFVVFSSNPAHVKKGALFSLYPDNVGMGRSLAAIALKRAQDDRLNPPGIVPLHDLLIAVNLRTAEHLGLKLTRRQKRKFNLVFPSR